MVLLTLGRVCVLVGVQKERGKNEVKQQKNEINAVSIQVVRRTDSVTFVSKCLGLGWRCEHKDVPSFMVFTILERQIHNAPASS